MKSAPQVMINWSSVANSRPPDAAVAGSTMCRSPPTPCNDGPIPLSIHGQHEQHGLADTDVQRRLVDDAGDHDDLLATVAGRFGQWRRGRPSWRPSKPPDPIVEIA